MGKCKIPCWHVDSHGKGFGREEHLDQALLEKDFYDFFNYGQEASMVDSYSLFNHRQDFFYLGEVSIFLGKGVNCIGKDF